MFCESCGSALRSGAKFCGSCGTKVGGASARPEPKTIELAPSPLGLATCDLSIDDVTAETDSDGDVSLSVKYTVTNNTSEDWDYLVIRAQVLRGDGVPLEETRDTQEQMIAAGESNEFEAYLRFNAKTLGGTSRTATVLMSANACGAVIEPLDQFDVPTQPFEMVELKPAQLGDQLRLISGSLLKREPDSDGDVSVEVKALVQSLTAQHLPAVTLLAKINDKAMREIMDATVTEEVRPGEVCVLSGYGNAKDKRLKDAKAALSIRVYYPLATGHCQHAEVEIRESEPVDSASSDDDEEFGEATDEGLNSIDIEQSVSALVQEFKNNPRNKTFVPMSVLLMSAQHELQKKIRMDHLIRSIRNYLDGTMSAADQETYDAAIAVLGEVARGCFADNRTDLDYTISWIENDGEFCAEIRP